MNHEFLTVEDIAKIFNLNRRSVQRKFKTGELKGVKIFRKWRITKEEFEKYISPPTESVENLLN